jgi:aspartate racemase
MPRLSEAMLRRLLEVDGGPVAIVAEVGQECAGIARYVALADQPGTAEVAVTVTDRSRGHGIGRLLVQALRPAAVRAGLTTLVDLVEPTNRPALQLLRSLVSSSPSAAAWSRAASTCRASRGPTRRAARLQHLAGGRGGQARPLGSCPIRIPTGPKTSRPTGRGHVRPARQHDAQGRPRIRELGIVSGIMSTATVVSSAGRRCWRRLRPAGWFVRSAGRGPEKGARQHMKRIGLLGGMSWESSAEYYRFVNEVVRERLGGLHSADCLLRSVDFAVVEDLQRTGRWDEAGKLLAAEAQALVAGGAELLVLCTNTMHRVADQIAAAVPIPLVHIADASADAVRAAGLSTVGLLATAYTMEQDFYVGRLERTHGLAVLVPGPQDRRLVHEVIYRELCLGIVKDDSREAYRRVIAELVGRGAEGILLGCTELDLLIGPHDAPVPVFDTTRLHAERAVDLALAT